MEARALMGEDFWSYGIAANRKTLETFLRHHHAQGLSSRLLTPEEMFHPGTHEFVQALTLARSASMATIRVMSGGAPKEVFAQLTPQFRAAQRPQS